MKVRRCSQSWRVDALRDGRIEGREAARFESHLATCAECRLRSSELEGLLHKLHSLPTGVPSELTVRRQREQLQRTYDGMLRTKPALPTRWILALVAFVALSVFGATAWLHHLAPSTQTSWVTVAASEGARWVERRNEEEDRITLHDGYFHLSIHRASPRNRVVLVLPDGEIEDMGTVLEVWIENNQTNYVAVRKGEIALRLDGVSPVRLRAGESWRHAKPSGQLEPRTLPSSGQPPSSPGPLRAPQGPGVASTGGPASARQAASAGAAKSSRRFADAPNGMSAEDLAYTRVIQLIRTGDERALETARDYLDRFPHGLRRIEVMHAAARLAQERQHGDAPSDSTSPR